MLIKKLPTIDLINKIRSKPENYGLVCNHETLNIYNDYELFEMSFGIYKSSQTLLVDGDYLLNLNDVNKVICVLSDVSYINKPKKANYLDNSHNCIDNIRTFYIENYYLISNSPIYGNFRHGIASYLHKIGVLKHGLGEKYRLFSYSNSYKSLQSFKNVKIPKDLFLPIKYNINEQFFNDSYKINDFILESEIKIERSRNS